MILGLKLLLNLLTVVFDLFLIGIFVNLGCCLFHWRRLIFFDIFAFGIDAALFILALFHRI